MSTLIVAHCFREGLTNDDMIFLEKAIFLICLSTKLHRKKKWNLATLNKVNEINRVTSLFCSIIDSTLLNFFVVKCDWLKLIR